MTDERIEKLRRLLPQAMLRDWLRLGSRLVRLLRDGRHGAHHEALLDRLLREAQASVERRVWRQANRPQVHYPPNLPISARRQEVVDAIRSSQVVVVAGETGSGKTTQLPKMCLEAGLGVEALIGCTQPRRIAALSVSRRIAEELNCTWGREVGCKIRFDDRTGPETYVKLMTDGILLAEIQGDPLLSEYNAILIDEAHERSLNIDFLLGYFKTLLAKRPELKLIITSATIDTKAFGEAFGAPVIEVSGRVYPVEVIYAPLEAEREEAGEVTYIDAAARAAEQALCEPGSGDVLVFMPGERDIRETSDQLRTRVGEEAEIIPLYGRLSAAEQQRVFAPGGKTKVIVATNIAETSLTIPGIRYVVDTGLARVSRYSSRARARRLPIEPISQSSANQRKGRSGRVQNGVCIRLYSEADFAARPAYTQPEIQRCNLAEVILRMKAFRLGEIETFPFLNPPTPAAIQAGYALLQELGALTAERGLTPLGEQLARLPIDPTLGRMLLQSQREHATQELLIIAAGLSIQDPRERPLDQKEAAGAAHRRFEDGRSDFLTLLNLWNAVHEEWEQLRTQNQRRKFCKAHFLSYLRMREWQDLYAQLHDALEELGNVRLNESTAAYEAIHRSILAGLLGHVAKRQERNQYRTAAGRQAMVFPGSVLFARADSSVKGRGKPREPKPAPPKQPEWVVAGEMVETSQLFARTVAGIDPEWVLELAPHLCRTTYQHPHWSPAAGQVLVEERVTFYNLDLRKRHVAYSNVNAEDATRIFIRSALVEEPPAPTEEEEPPAEQFPKSQAQILASVRVRNMPPRPPWRFLDHNRQLRHKLEIWQTRMRGRERVDLDQALFDYYTWHLKDVASVHDMNRLLRGKPQGFLCASESDLIASVHGEFDETAFPNEVELGGQKVPLSYAYSPGEDHDGVTLRLSPSLVRDVSPAQVEWSIPGLREAQIASLLRSLPKSLRRQLMPLHAKVAEVLGEFQPGEGSLLEDLAAFLRKRYGLEVSAASWPADALPAHLRPRIEVTGLAQAGTFTGRDVREVTARLESAKLKPAQDPPNWQRECAKWERFALTSWNFGDLPERIEVGQSEAGPVHAWPGLQLEEGQVNLRLFRSQSEARQAGLAGFRRLVELGLGKSLAWLEKDLRGLATFASQLAGWTTLEALRAQALEHIKRHALPSAPPPPPTQSAFAAAVEEARIRLQEAVAKFEDLLRPLLELRWECLRKLSTDPAPSGRMTSLSQLSLGKPATPPVHPLRGELDALMPANFLEVVPFHRLPALPRYLKALLIRAERCRLNPVKDRERAALVAPYLTVLHQLRAGAKTQADREAVEDFRWLVEEYKVSVFAQELGTAVPVSPKRLDQHLAALRGNG